MQAIRKQIHQIETHAAHHRPNPCRPPEYSSNATSGASPVRADIWAGIALPAHMYKLLLGFLGMPVESGLLRARYDLLRFFEMLFRHQWR